MSVIDTLTFTELQDNTGADFVVELLQAFLDDAPALFVTLHSAQASGDAAAFRRAAHSLKSNGTTFGAVELGALARELEETPLPALGDQVGAKLAKLETVYAASAAALRSLCNG